MPSLTQTTAGSPNSNISSPPRYSRRARAPGRLRAKRAVIEEHEPQWQEEGLRKQSLRVPATQRKQATVLGTGADAVPALLGVLDEWGVLP